MGAKLVGMRARSGMRVGVTRLAITACCLVLTLATAFAQSEEEDVTPRVAGIPVGIFKEAFANPDPVMRQKIFALIEQEFVRDPEARQRLLEVDPVDAAARLARFARSAEILAGAKDQSPDPAVRAKLDEIIAAIVAARGGTQ